jgi:hypothetical protein
MDNGYLRPYHYFLVPEDERERRVEIDQDLCRIDGRVHPIRGVIEVPVLDADHRFALGIWAVVSRDDFHRYLDLCSEDGADEPPFAGTLSGEPPGYYGLLGHPVSIQLATASERPKLGHE